MNLEHYREQALTGRGPVSDLDRYRQLSRMPKHELAQLHVRNGGLMGLAAYMQWRKDELVAAILEDERH